MHGAWTFILQHCNNHRFLQPLQHRLAGPGLQRSFSTDEVSRRQGFLVFPPNRTAEGTGEIVGEAEEQQQALWLQGCPRSITVLDKLRRLCSAFQVRSCFSDSHSKRSFQKVIGFAHKLNAKLASAIFFFFLVCKATSETPWGEQSRETPAVPRQAALQTGSF